MSKKLITALSAIFLTTALAAFSMSGVFANTGAAVNDSMLPSVEEAAGGICLPESSVQDEVGVAAEAAAQEDPGVPAPSFKCIRGLECSSDEACGPGYCAHGICWC